MNRHYINTKNFVEQISVKKENISTQQQTNGKNKMVDTFGTNLILGLLLLAAGHHCAPVDQSTEVGAINVAVPNNRVNGESLIEVGKLSHLDFVEMIGNAVKNAEALSDSAVQILGDSLKGDVSALKEQIETKICEIEPCTSWSHWSDCSASRLFDTFGIKRRSRICWLNETSPCDHSGNGTIDERAEICKGTACPSPYQITHNNGSSFFLYLNVTSQTRDSADNMCQQLRGGHVINVDNIARLALVKSICETNNNVYIWVSGRRQNDSSPWIFLIGENPESNGLLKWYGSEPNSGDECMVVRVFSQDLLWKGRSCTSSYLTVCEIRAI